MTLPLIAVIGAGPAGLAAAFELLKNKEARVLLLEMDEQVGGISRTVRYKGNYIDIGGHRFFSKSDDILNWWFQFLPLDQETAQNQTLQYQGKNKVLTSKAVVDAGVDKMRVTPRRSRILHQRSLFDYPLSLSFATIHKLGWINTFWIGISYSRAKLFPIKNEITLEDYIINHFGKRLYLKFFKSYTEKVWGVAPSEIPASWGRQRIKGLSLGKALHNTFKKRIGFRSSSSAQKEIPTSLIEYFLYPPYGPGQLWEKVKDTVQDLGADIRMATQVVALGIYDCCVQTITIQSKSGEKETVAIDAVFSSMPIQSLISAMHPPAPTNIRTISDGLMYRDFVTVGILTKTISVDGQNNITASGLAALLPDTWIYIQEPDIKMGRIQIFNNWSSNLVADSDTVWLGLEYFLSDNDPLHSKSDDEIAEIAKQELELLSWVQRTDILDFTVIRTKKAYPAYFGTYDRFSDIQVYLDSIANLFPMGRNGLHRYNNMDHSMLTAFQSVNVWRDPLINKKSVWDVMSDDNYFEEKSA